MWLWPVSRRTGRRGVAGGSRSTPETGQLTGAGKRGAGGGLEGLHDGTWTRLGKRRSGNRHFGRVTAEMFVGNESMLFGYESLVGWSANNRWCFAVAKSKTAGSGTLPPQEYTWRLIMPRDAQVEALALSGNAPCERRPTSGSVASSRSAQSHS